jgi:hypothetical protein
MTGISGAQANHAKKHTKNAIQVTWKARIWGVRRLNSSMRVALLKFCKVVSGQGPMN